MVSAKEDGHKGQPDDAGRVHREPDVLRLVEVLCRSKEAYRNFVVKTSSNVAVDLLSFN